MKPCKSLSNSRKELQQILSQKNAMKTDIRDNISSTIKILDVAWIAEYDFLTFIRKLRNYDFRFEKISTLGLLVHLSSDQKYHLSSDQKYWCMKFVVQELTGMIQYQLCN